jgi:universal stress protein A
VAVAAKRLPELLPADVAEPSRPDLLVRVGRPSREILAVARETDTRLITLGVTGRSSLDLALFGSTTNEVIRNAPCAVMTVRCG